MDNFNYISSFKRLLKLFIPPIMHPRGNGLKELIDIFWTFISLITFSKKISREGMRKYDRLVFTEKAVRKVGDDCKYLEIGVCNGYIFNRLKIKNENKYGVDPDRGGNYKMTSDQFFSQNKEKKFDVIFIDGLHHYDQCQKDIINSLNCLNENGIILIHDMIPTNSLVEYTPRRAINSHWTGDVWKCSVEIQNSKNLDFAIANCDCGVGILKPKKNYEYKVLPEIKDMRFKEYYENYYKKLPILSPEDAYKFI